MSPPPAFFAVWATDRPGTGELRGQVREAHRARLRAPRDDGLRVHFGGPTLDEHATMNGTLLIVEARDADGVRAFMAEDPYVVHGVYAHVEVRPWAWGLGHPQEKASG